MSKTIKSILLAGLVTLSANVLALNLKADAPERYTVKKTDTLWDIAGKYTNSPWEWPGIWYVNPQIENPHLIFPGDEISLIQVEGQPRVTVTARGEASNTVKLKPNARIEPIEAAIPAIPQDAIRSFLRNNRIVTAQELDSAPRVLAGVDERILFGAGEKLYARGDFGTTAPVYGVYRQGKLYRDPATNEVLGLEALEVGAGRVLGQQDDIVTLQLERTNQHVAIGDVLLTNEESDLNSTFYPKAPAKAINGRIIASASGMDNIGQFDIVVLNRGEREGLEKGAVLQVSKAGAVVYDRKAGDKVRLPSEQAGTVMVFRTTEKLAYALVLRTSRALSVGDSFENPAL